MNKVLVHWVVIGGGALAFILSFLPWYSVSYTGPGLYGGTASGNAWRVGFGAWFPMLLLFVLAAVVFAAHRGVRIPIPVGLHWISLGASALAAIIVLIRWITYPREHLHGLHAGAGFGLYLGLLTALAMAAASFSVVRLGGKLPATS